MLFSFRLKSVLIVTLLCMNSSSHASWLDYIDAHDWTDSMKKIQSCLVIALFAAGLKTLLNRTQAFQKLPDASQASKGFVEEIAAHHHIKPDFTVKVGDQNAAGIGTIILENSGIEPDTTVLDYVLYTYHSATTPEEKEMAEQELYRIAATLDHELTHYKNNDTRNLAIAATLIGLLIWGGYSYLEFHHLKSSIESLPRSIQALYAIVSGIGLGVISSALWSWQSRRKEARADEGVRNDPLFLKHKITQFEYYQECLEKEMATTLKGKLLLKIAKIFPSAYLLKDLYHPTFPDRIARFKERLAALEKEQSKTVTG